MIWYDSLRMFSFKFSVGTSSEINGSVQDYLVGGDSLQLLRIQFTPPTPTRRDATQLDSFVASGRRCELGIKQ